MEMKPFSYAAIAFGLMVGCAVAVAAVFTLVDAVVFLILVVTITVLIVLYGDRVRPFMSAVDRNDAFQDPNLWQTAEELNRMLAALALDLAAAFNDSDHAQAVEIWRRPQNQFTPEDFIELMRDARSNDQRWNGRKVDANLEAQWAKFCEETYAYSLDDFMLTLHDRSKPKR